MNIVSVNVWHCLGKVFFPSESTQIESDHTNLLRGLCQGILHALRLRWVAKACKSSSSSSKIAPCDIDVVKQSRLGCERAKYGLDEFMYTNYSQMGIAYV